MQPSTHLYTRKDETLSWPPYNGRHTHISGHPSAASRVHGQGKLAGQGPTFYHFVDNRCDADKFFSNLLVFMAVVEYRCMALTFINAATAVLITQDTESTNSAYQCWVGSEAMLFITAKGHFYPRAGCLEGDPKKRGSF